MALRGSGNAKAVIGLGLMLLVPASACRESVVFKSSLPLETAEAPLPGDGTTSEHPEQPRWVTLDNGIRMRADHPRVFITKEKFEEALAKMVGPKARDPYKRWFGLLKDAEDKNHNVDLAALAILFRGTGDGKYLERFVSSMLSMSATQTPNFNELRALDILFDHVKDDVKFSVMKRVSDNPDGFYWNALNESRSSIQPSWGYHKQIGVALGLLYSGIFAGTPFELNKDSSRFRFDAHNFIRHVKGELAPSGYFWQVENRIAGEPLNNPGALPGSFGGMYDNFGYDWSEESHSVLVPAEYFHLTGEDRFTGFLHDQYRATFWQNMQYPYKYDMAESDRWCHRKGDEWHTVARIWNTQTDYMYSPNTSLAPLTASLYRDPRMQHFVNHGSQPELCGGSYDGLYMHLLFYDDTLMEEPPSSNPTASYFSGPGLVSMRSGWDNDAAFGVFIAGEAISRRYEDAGSFLLGRKVDVMLHGAARIRGNADNERAHWYHIRSIAKNTMKIFDPLESFDIAADGSIGPLHSGPVLVPSDNLGGQIFQTATSKADNCFYAPDGSTSGCATSLYRKGTAAMPLGVYERANILRYEHRPALFTYSMADATASYTRKIEFFEREFLFLRPDVFVIFDRVKSANPAFKKVWVTHTVDKPIASGAPVPLVPPLNMGVRVVDNSRALSIANPLNNTQMTMLLPEANRVMVRGGDTVLVSPQFLAAGGDIQGAPLAELDIPRWVELFAVGGDTAGSVTLYGDAQEGDATTETITFGAKTQKEETASGAFTLTSTSLQDKGKRWTVDQWKGYRLELSGTGVAPTILGNSSDTLYFANVGTVSPWAYVIDRPVANSYKHWKRITKITTSDLTLSHFSVSVPHYFDAEDASGRLHSFSPHTDSKHDGYSKRKDLGQYTINIEATEPRLLDQFLNVIAMRDPGAAMPIVSLQKDQMGAFSGAWIDRSLVMFANSRELPDTIKISWSTGTATQVFIADLVPGGSYTIDITSGTLEIAAANRDAARSLSASPMGVLTFYVASDGTIHGL